MYYIEHIQKVSEKIMVTTVRLSSAADEKLSKLAKETGRTKSFYLRKLIEENLEKLLLQYRILQSKEDYTEGKLETISFEEMEKLYGMEN